MSDKSICDVSEAKYNMIETLGDLLRRSWGKYCESNCGSNIGVNH